MGTDDNPVRKNDASDCKTTSFDCGDVGQGNRRVRNKVAYSWA